MVIATMDNRSEELYKIDMHDLTEAYVNVHGYLANHISRNDVDQSLWN